MGGNEKFWGIICNDKEIFSVKIDMNSPKESLFAMREYREWFVHQAQTLPVDVALGNDEWSLIEVIEHLVAVEKALLMMMMRASQPMPERDDEANKKFNKYSEILRNGTKYEVPNAAVLPARQTELHQLLADWEKTQSKLASMIESGKIPSDKFMVFDHPVFGPMNAHESIHFLADHLVYHRKRIEELMAVQA